MPDHIHLLVSLPTTLALADFVIELKISSSKWLKENPKFPLFNGWSKEYAAFSYAEKDKNMIADYIKLQKEHHKTVSFTDEYKAFLKENGVSVNDDFFLSD